MDTPLLRTKLYIPPPRPELITRPRLIERLNAGTRSGHKLTLVSAPAGFGKTTLVSEWTHTVGAHRNVPLRVAWLSLDENDNDLTRFLTYLIGALQTVETDIGQGMLRALQSPQLPPSESILTALINEIAVLPDPIVLVLDDYHLIETQSVHDTVAFLLQHLPPNTGPSGQCQGLHLVITTREDPPLPLARLRARGQLVEVRAADLRFTSAEAAAFLNQVMGLTLSAQDITALETRTEGWIAGLQLAALSIQGSSDATGFITSFTGSHRYVLDYLVQEVLEQQPEHVQRFLLQTAILDRLTGPLCDAVTGQENCQTILEMLERANLFIVPLDGERRWYRYHHLFADLLRQQLQQSSPSTYSASLQGAGAIPPGVRAMDAAELHVRAGTWYEQNGFADQAIEHVLHAKDYERSAQLIEEHIDAIWQRGEHTRLRRWLSQLPVESVLAKPHLCIVQAWDLFTSGHHAAAEQKLQAAEHAVAALPIEQGQPLDPDRMTIQGRAAAIRAFLASYRGELPGTIQFARQALDNLPRQDLSWRSAAAIALGDAYSLGGELAKAYQTRLEAVEASRAGGNIYMIASLKLADTCRQQGQLQRAVEICQQQWQLAQESGMSETVVVGWLLAIWGEVLAELDDLDGALDQAQKGVELTERGQDAMVIGWSNLCLIRVLFSKGDLVSAGKIVQKMENIARKHDIPPFITNPMAAWQARIWLAQDKLDFASQWAQERGLNTEGGATLLHEPEYMVLARILIAQGQVDDTTRLLQRLFVAAEAGRHTTRAIEILLLQALTFQSGDNTAQAMVTLERALALGEPGGYVRIFVDEGPPMAHLLYQALTRGIAPDYARRLLAAFPASEPQQTDSSKAQVAGSDLIEPLTDRELEILELIAEGLTNPEVATKLFLSLHTVKAHSHNIYGKLGVHNRTQAVTKARALGILPSA